MTTRRPDHDKQERTDTVRFPSLPTKSKSEREQSTPSRDGRPALVRHPKLHTTKTAHRFLPNRVPEVDLPETARRLMEHFFSILEPEYLLTQNEKLEGGQRKDWNAVRVQGRLPLSGAIVGGEIDPQGYPA